MSNYTGFLIRPTRLSDLLPIYELYEKVAQTNGGIICTATEVTPQYVEDFLVKSQKNGFQSLHLYGIKFGSV